MNQRQLYSVTMCVIIERIVFFRKQYVNHNSNKSISVRANSELLIFVGKLPK